MRLTTSAALLLLSLLGSSTNLVRAAGEQSPFYYDDAAEINDVNILKYQKTGKMEQIGRTGVAAMHAVLLK